MYTDEDLNLAVKEGVLSKQSAEAFRRLISSQKNSVAVDEENFKLVGSFNDIFVVIACTLLLFSSYWVLESAIDSFDVGFVAITGLSWFLAEFFVRKRNMALPAIVLLLSFIGGALATAISVFGSSEEAMIAAFAVSAVAAYCHWLRFKVPITVAAGTAAAVGLITFSVMSVLADTASGFLAVLFLCGLLSFAIAMWWDASDTERTTHRTDVAFWLHLLSAPLIIHPVFYGLGVLEGNERLSNMAIVVLLYVMMTVISITIDRRALMVSSLVYVLYAITSLLNAYGNVGEGFAITGVFMGGMLLLLTALWHRVRAALLSHLPSAVKSYIPKT